MRIHALGSYVSVPLLIKKNHLKEEEFNFLFIICKKPKSDFSHSLLMTEENAFHKTARFLPQENIVPEH